MNIVGLYVAAINVKCCYSYNVDYECVELTQIVYWILFRLEKEQIIFREISVK